MDTTAAGAPQSITDGERNAMPRAGFWAVGGYEISFRTDGRWYADEEPIANERIALLFSRHIRPDGKGGWMIDVGIDRQTVVVVDTPLVVLAVTGTPASGFRVRTNDGVEDELDCATLRVGRGDVLYCDVDRGDRGVMKARFLRPAYYELARWIADDAGAAVLRCRDAAYAVAREPD
jgi:hypothetical protein